MKFNFINRLTLARQSAGKSISTKIIITTLKNTASILRGGFWSWGPGILQVWQLSYAVVTCETKLFWNNVDIILVFYFTCNHRQWLYVHKTLKLFQNYFSVYFTCDHVWNYFKIISAAEITSKNVQRLIVAHKYFQHVQCRRIISK